MTYSYQYPRPAVTTDCIIISKDNTTIRIMLIQRKNEPYKDKWALPGGFVEIDEDLEDAAKRELEEETGLKEVDLKQLRTYGTPGRDPRGRIISVVYYGYANHKTDLVQASSDTKNINWLEITNLPPLAFDHNEIIEFAIRELALKNTI